MRPAGGVCLFSVGGGGGGGGGRVKSRSGAEARKEGKEGKVRRVGGATDLAHRGFLRGNPCGHMWSHMVTSGHCSGIEFSKNWAGRKLPNPRCGGEM